MPACVQFKDETNPIENRKSGQRIPISSVAFSFEGAAAVPVPVDVVVRTDLWVDFWEDARGKFFILVDVLLLRARRMGDYEQACL